jgi:hypothetical protein
MKNILLASCLLTSSSALRMQTWNINGKANRAEVGSKNQMSLVTEQQKGQGAKLFCFAWITGSPNEVALALEAQKQLAKCDGFAFFTDKDAPAAVDEVRNMVRVDVPSQQGHTDKMMSERSGKKWLNHKNMVGLMPAWSHLFRFGSDIENYDYVINTEVDHYVRPHEVKSTIGSWMEQASLDGTDPLMLNFGNAFVFNKGMVKTMRQKWSELNQVSQSGDEVGCPTLYPHGTRCEQDMWYPKIAGHLNIKQVGQPGCGQETPLVAGGKLRLPCWDFHQINVKTGDNMAPSESENTVLSTIAASDKHMYIEKPSFSVQRMTDGTNVKWEHFTPDRHIAIIHHMNKVETHQFAAKVLP